MTTLDPGGPHVDGRAMLIAELEDRLTAAQGEIRRLLALVEEHRDRAEAAHNLHANAERLLAEAKRRECTALCRDVEEDRDRLLPVVEAVGKWVEVRQNPRMVATDHDDRALMIAYAAMPAADALGTDAADGAGTGEHWAAGHVEVLAQVAIERKRQDAKWGEQNHADGTGMAWPELVIPAFGWASGGNQAEQAANLVRKACQRAAKTGHTTWLHILLEEIAETFAETDPAALRVELIQTAAVAVAWAEALDRRAAASPAGSSTADEGVAR